jgi:hypothetical protein
MTRLTNTSAVAAALFALLALPTTGEGQTPSATKGTATITIEVDPWLVGLKNESSRPSSSQSSQSRILRANLRSLDDALEPYRMNYRELTDDQRADVRRAFGDVLPGQRFTTYRINEPQARAIAFLALGPTRGRRGDDRRCELAVKPEPEVVQTGAPVRSSWCDAALDTMSRNAAWIHTSILSLSRSGAARRPKSEELDDLRAMSDRAREIVVSTPRCGCRVGDDADALLTATREASEAVAASSVPAWMTLRSEQVQRISKLSDSVERFLLRCLSNR